MEKDIPCKLEIENRNQNRKCMCSHKNKITIANKGKSPRPIIKFKKHGDESHK